MVEYIAKNPGHLKEIAEERYRNGYPGPVLLERSTLYTMQHTPLLAAVIFNPFGPTIETISIAQFEGFWESCNVVMLRRSLHPLCDDRIQILASVPHAPDLTKTESIDMVLSLFIANNGRSLQSEGWAKLFLETLPSGIIIAPFANRLQSRIRLAFRCMLRQMDESLASDAHRLEQSGPDYWALATLEMREALRNLSVDNPEVRMQPELVESLDPESPAPGNAFDRWWELVASREYQTAIHCDLPAAWIGASEQVPDLLDLEKGCGLGDFLSWWRLFVPPGMEGR